MGLIAGILGKWIMPGKDPGGFIVTILLGIGGALLGGWIGSMLGVGTVDSFSLGSIALAVGGALIILFLYRKFSSKPA
ncbi:MAG TPA: GlsB/YeaQ/YmgE family stress response membrane protein [Gemmatimonadales bacterium]|nr:GlsB/YeaQ/YmgE family stress response membrane protein [Gemmatimonadales bacterium]